MDENDETVSNKSKFSFSVPVVKTPKKKKKKKENSRSLQAQQEVAKLKDENFEKVQNLSSEFEKFENVPIMEKEDKEEENLPLSPVLGFCAKCGKNYNKIPLLMLHKKGLYGSCLKVKKSQRILETDLIKPFRRLAIDGVPRSNPARSWKLADPGGSNLKFKMNSDNDEFFMCVNQNKPDLFENRMSVRIGAYFAVFTLGMLCLGITYLMCCLYVHLMCFGNIA